MTKLENALKGSYQKYIAEDFLNTEFFNKRLPLIVEIDGNIDADFERKLKDKIKDVYGDINLVCSYGASEKEYSLSDFKFGESENSPESDSLKCSVIIDAFEMTQRKRFDFSDFVEIMKKLRAENGCEWDRAQTHESIRINLIEEAYELVEGIDCKNNAMMLEECGDVLMQAVFHTEIAEEEGAFNFTDMLTALCRKLIDRHTHIFGNNHANNADEALTFWTEAKKKEKKYTSSADAMNRVPKNLPSLLFAEKIQKVAKKSGLYTPSYETALSDFRAAADSFERAVKQVSDEDEKISAAGELLFKAVDVLRTVKIEPEMALHERSLKFLKEFEELESANNKPEN